MSYINTYTKKLFDPLAPDVDSIDIIDIAHALSLTCRANGHFPIFYSVAQHSINCMNEAIARGYSKKVQLGCLLHDASEAYMSDITRPVKKNLANYIQYEKVLQDKIFEKWGLSALNIGECNKITDIDDAILYYEFVDLMDERLFETKPMIYSNPQFITEDFSAVENKFIKCFERLTRQ
ncbi:MAG: phosphohydrolase [Clostridia bacterium]|nr:phosphohydrolase [Clostridia bacterium]